MPGEQADDGVFQLVVFFTEDQVAQVMIRVQARQQAGQPVILVEDRPVKLADLEKALKEYAGKGGKTELLIDAVGVDWGTLVAIQDAAKGAGLQRAYYLKQK